MLAESAGYEKFVYRMHWKRQIAAVVLFGGAFCFAVALWGGFLLEDRLDGGWAIALPAVLLFCSAILAAHTLLSAVVLDQKGVEVRTLLGTRRLASTQIRGRRQYVSRGGWEATGSLRYRLEPAARNLPFLDFEASYGFDDTFRRWFATLPDLDALEPVGDEQVFPVSRVERRSITADKKQHS